MASSQNKKIYSFFLGIITLLFPIFCKSLDVPTLNSFVTDNAKLFSASEKSDLEQTLKSIQDATSDQIVILTIDSLEGEVLENYSIEVVKKNNRPKKER